jgi:hypothetical protein
MDAIRSMKTMAGSPGAESAKHRNQRPAILRMVFAFLGGLAFAKP